MINIPGTLFLTGCCLLLLAGCGNSENSSTTLSERLVYETEIAMQIPDAPTYYNIARGNRETWIENILLQSIHSHRKTYSADRLPIRNDLIPFLVSMSSLFDKITLSEIDTPALIRSHIPYFNRLLCEETWSFTPNNMLISKTTQGFSLAYHRSSEDTTVNETLFWFFHDFPNTSNNPTLLCETIEYNVSIVDDANPVEWWKNNIEPQHRTPFLSDLINKLQSGEVICYSDPSCRNKISWNEYSQSLLSPTLPMLDEDGDTIPELFPQHNKAPLTTDNISALKFIESWYYDTISLQLTKKIHAYSPMRTVFDENGNYKGIESSVWIKAE